MRNSPGCSCCSCLIFEDGYGPKSDLWDVRTGSMTDNGNEVDLGTDTLAVVSTLSISGDGSLSASFRINSSGGTKFKAGIVFGYLNDDNYNYVILEDINIFGSAITQYFERRSGTDTKIGNDEVVGNNAIIAVCWKLGNADIESLVGWGNRLDPTKLSRGISSMPGNQFGIISKLGINQLEPLNGEYKANKNSGDCLCGCDCVNCADPHIPRELDGVATGYVTPDTDMNQAYTVNCTVFPGAYSSDCSWEVGPGAGANFMRVEMLLVSGDYVLQVTHDNIVYQKNLGSTITKCWCLDETFTNAHVTSNPSSIDTTGVSIVVSVPTVAGITPTCP